MSILGSREDPQLFDVGADLPDDTQAAFQTFLREVSGVAAQSGAHTDRAMRWGEHAAAAYFDKAGLLQVLVIRSGRISRDEKLPDLRRQTELRKRLLNDADGLSPDELQELREAGVTVTGNV